MGNEAKRVVEHERFGEVRIPAAEVLRFEPLPGFPEAREFALLAHDRESTFAWLVCLDDPKLAFVVTDPLQFFPSYEPPLGEENLESVGAKSREDLLVLSMVSLREGGPTLNLLAPLLLCSGAGRGRQLILDATDYPTAQPLPEVKALPAAPAAGAPAPDQIESKPQR